jgi:hypothetical protein
MERWTSAQERCSWNRGHLATIQSIEENNFLAPTVAAMDTMFWLGAAWIMTPDVASDTWKATEWVTGEPLDYKNWAPSNPRGLARETKYEYMAMNPTGKWENLENKILNYFLEIEN